MHVKTAKSNNYVVECDRGDSHSGWSAVSTVTKYFKEDLKRTAIQFHKTATDVKQLLLVIRCKAHMHSLM